MSFFLGGLLTLLLALLPIYLFPSGGFQIVDIPILFIFLATIVYSLTGKDYYILKNIYYFLPFMFWSILINSIYFFIYGNKAFIFHNIPMIYAFFLMLFLYFTFIKLINENGIIYIYTGLFLSILLCLTAKGFSYKTERMVLSFNDPNQLGYFAIFILSYTIILMSYRKKYLLYNIWYSSIDIFLIIVAHFFLFLSISRSTIFAFLFLDACLLKNLKRNFQIVISLLLIAGFLLFLRPTFIEERLRLRPGHFQKETAVEQLMERIFAPFKNVSGEELFFGKGIGRRNFKSDIPGIKEPQVRIEVHNIIGWIIHAFGLIGLSLFIFWGVNLLLCFRVIKDSFWVMAAIFTFNMGINGLRWRILWIFLAFMLAMASFERKNQEKQNP
jgi:hypothetical protein